MPGHNPNGENPTVGVHWPKRILFGATGVAAAGIPLLSGTCSGSCTSCLRCAAGASGLLILLAAGSIGRRIAIARRDQNRTE